VPPSGGEQPEAELPDLLPQRRSLPVVWRVLALIGGVLFIALGFLGWLVPIVTGIPFYVVGLGLLGLASRRARGWINTAERRLPHRLRLLLRPGRKKRGGD
jgi:hypothetical protein